MFKCVVVVLFVVECLVWGVAEQLVCVYCTVYCMFSGTNRVSVCTSFS